MSAWVHAESLPMQVYSTAIDEVRRVVLNGRLALLLNTGSGATVMNGAQHCDVTLDHGEVLFELERESPLQLRVLAGDSILTSRAAKFSVRLRDMKTVEVIVRSGQVTAGTTMVGEHQFARISPAGVILRELDSADEARRFNWATGHITLIGVQGAQGHN
jgi:ferric-dicitrate binding protein FerR (iron transport regulator)